MSAEEKKSAEEKQEELKIELSAGTPMEVLNADNKLIFLGRVSQFDGKVVEIAEASGLQVPPVLYNTEVKLRFFLTDIRSMVLLGQVCGSTNLFWKVDRLKNLFTKEHRAFFRQEVSNNAMVGPYRGGSGNIVSCLVTDISGGGLCFLCEDRSYQVDELLMVTGAQLIAGEPPFSFTCRVRRRDGQLHGCQFERMDEKEQDRLLGAIFAMQRKNIQRRRQLM